METWILDELSDFEKTIISSSQHKGPTIPELLTLILLELKEIKKILVNESKISKAIEKLPSMNCSSEKYDLGPM